MNTGSAILEVRVPAQAPEPRGAAAAAAVMLLLLRGIASMTAAVVASAKGPK